MKNLDVELRLNEENFHKKLSDLDVSNEGKISKTEARELIESRGVKIKNFKPINPGKLRLVGCDASILKRELRFNAIWASHTVLVDGLFDGDEHEDVLSGRLNIWYRDLQYDDSIDFGVFSPYSGIDERLDSIRLSLECDKLANQEVESDFLVFDGSLKTSMEKLSKRKGYDEHSQAVKSMKSLMGKKCVAMVEDTHDNSFSKKLGLNITDLLLFDIALEDFEYVAFEGEVNVCYIKLPGKKVEYDGESISSDLTVRWEFNHGDYLDSLSKISYIWLKENDILHPQVYPIRIADYFTRKIKVSGILDEICFKKNLKPKNRELRTI